MASQKILIVDDSKTIRMQMRDMLPKGNFEILEAADGVEGLELIEQECYNLAVILLDFFMPRLNGWEVMRQLQANPKLKGVAVVMMSGRREEVERTIPDLFDYFEFVSKPFDPPILVKAIKAAMAKARTRQQAAVVNRSTESAPTPAIASTATTAHSDSTDKIQMLSVQMQALRQENAKLKAEVDGLKKQVAQILAFIRQKMK